MREIKFRAIFDKSIVEYIKWENCQWMYSVDQIAWSYEPKNAHTRLSQFTGITDRDGKEIYEGDVVQAWSEGYQHTGEVRWRDAADGRGCPCYIIYPAWADGRFWHMNGGPSDHAIKVIGNTYENPELQSGDGNR